MCTCCPGCVLFPRFGCFAKVKDLMDNPPEKKAQEGKPEFDLSDVPVGDLRVCHACCCSICNFLCKYPECCGAKAEGICLCCQIEQSLCKTVTVENEAQICCICCDGGQYCVEVSTCCAFAHTCFCFDSRCACPPTEKVPCILTCLPGCTLVVKGDPKIACCPLLGDIVPECANVGKAQIAPEPVAQAPVQAQMMQVNDQPVQGQMIVQQPPQQVVIVQQPPQQVVYVEQPMVVQQPVMVVQQQPVYVQQPPVQYVVQQ